MKRWRCCCVCRNPPHNDTKTFSVLFLFPSLCRLLFHVCQLKRCLTTSLSWGKLVLVNFNIKMATWSVCLTVLHCLRPNVHVWGSLCHFWLVFVSCWIVVRGYSSCHVLVFTLGCLNLSAPSSVFCCSSCCHHVYFCNADSFVELPLRLLTERWRGKKVIRCGTFPLVKSSRRTAWAFCYVLCVCVCFFCQSTVQASLMIGWHVTNRKP